MNSGECIFPNPRFRKVSEHLYYCEDGEVMKQKYPLSTRVISYQELETLDRCKSQ